MGLATAFALLAITATQVSTAIASGQVTSATGTAAALPTSSTAAAAATLITPGTDCADSEALFNCLTTSWQQCASGQWSIAITQGLAEGGKDALVCAPVGLSYDMKIVYANGTALAAGSDATQGPGATTSGVAQVSGGTAQGTASSGGVAAPTSSVVTDGKLTSGVSSTYSCSGWWSSGVWRWAGIALVSSVYASL